MFEDPQHKEGRDSTAADSIVVSASENGGIVIRQHGVAAQDQGCVVVPAGQAENLIAAIRRQLNPGK